MPISPEHVIPQMYLPQLAALREAIFARILPPFDGIDEEAGEVEREALERLEEYAHEDSDPAMIAEAAQDAGLEHYELLTGTRQTVINAFAVAISHLFEQQRHLLSHRTIIDSEVDSKRREITYLKLLDSAGIDCEEFPQRPVLEELDLVANVAKHAEGHSADRLRAVRPELFVPVEIRGASKLSDGYTRPVHTPLMGEGLYVQAEDLRAYLEAVEAFWQFVLNKFSSRI